MWETQRARQGMLSKTFQFFILAFLLLGLQVAAQDAGSITSSSSFEASSTLSAVSRSTDEAITSTTASVDTPETSVGLADALSAASTASAQQSQGASMPPIPLPTDDNQYLQLLKLAPGMPPLQRTTEDSTAPDGAPVSNGTLAARSEEELQAMLDEFRPPRPPLHLRGLKERGSTLRVLCVGDSMSQGQQGDWTWRYRIWEWFNSNNIPVTFVGPWAGTVKPQAATPPVPPPLYGQTPPSSGGSFDGGYAAGVNPGWNSARHFAAWGRAAAVDQYLIQQVVQDHTPDLILLMLGFNDLGWFYSDSSGTLNSVYNLMQNARQANPNLSFAIANIPQRSSLNRKDLPANTDLYNKMLADAIPYWNSAQSPVALVQLKENFQCGLSGCPAGYDGLHPNALGEYQIAQAFSRTLYSSFGYGSGPIAIPGNIPARSLPQPSNFRVSSSPQGVTATWDPVYGAYGYEVMSKIDGVTDFTSGTVQANRYDQHWPVSNASYSMYVRALAGDQKGPWTQTLSAVARPQTAPAPPNVFVRPTDTGVTITWDRPTGPYTDSIVLYNVITWDLDTDCTYIIGNAFRSSPAVINGLIPGHRYLVAVETWNANGEGFPMVAHNVVPGAGVPNIPTGFRLLSSDATSVYATWDKMPNAGGYNVYMRNNYTNGTFTNNGGQGETCYTNYFLFPGTWNYQFCVSAYNGNLESYVAPWPCPYAPSPVSSMSPAPTCPGPKAWCAGGGQAWGPEPQDPKSTGVAPGTGNGVSGGGADRVTTFTTNVDGQPRTVTESIKTVTTTDSRGNIVTVVIVQPATPTGSRPPGASLVTRTSVGPDGTTTLLIETAYPYTTTDAQGNTVTRTGTQSGYFPPGTGTPVSTTVITTTNDRGPTTYTATLRPTTATNGGTTYTGTITQGPSQPTSNTDTTYPVPVAFPTSASYSFTSVATNTHDSSGHPILAPWPICWFCPPGTNGIVLFGFSFGTIYFPGGPPRGPQPGFTVQFPTLTIDSQGNPRYSSSPEPTRSASTTSSTSCQSTSTATSITYHVSYYLNDNGATTETETYSTASTQTTGCSVTGTTVTSTTAGTYAFVCGTSCTACNQRRDATLLSTATPVPVVEKRKVEQNETTDLWRRDIPDYNANPGEFWRTVTRNAGEEGTEVLHGGFASGQPTSKFVEFLDFEQNVIVRFLRGCTSVVVVSRRGIYMNHLWERPGFEIDENDFTTYVLNYINNGRANENSPSLRSLIPTYFSDPATTRVFIMTPSHRPRDLDPTRFSFQNDAYMLGTMGASDAYNFAKFGPISGNNNKLDRLVNGLRNILPAGTQFQTGNDVFVYRRQTVDEKLGDITLGYGKAAVVYSNSQTRHPITGNALTPPQATWKCYMQGRLMGYDLWAPTAE